MSVREPAPHAELVQWYEDLRAQATDQIPATTPRGLALLLGSGLSAWMAACPPLIPVPASVTVANDVPVRSLAGLSVELVSVLTEMTLGGLRRCRA